MGCTRFPRYGDNVVNAAQWNEILADTGMTLVAIDRLVHHATILEMNAESIADELPSESKRDKAGKTLILSRLRESVDQIH